MPPRDGNFMQKRVTTVVLPIFASLAIGVGAVSAVSAFSAPQAPVSLSTAQKAAAVKKPLDKNAATGLAGHLQQAVVARQAVETASAATLAKHKPAKKKHKSAKKKHTKKAAANMPYGTATATSFWDPSTASGAPMSFHTIASPYWPLGTEVKVTYNGNSAVGVVEDFGPAEWAVAQHSPPAILDLSSKMMRSLSGTGDNTVVADFQVLKWGNGSSYRSSGTGYDLAYGQGG